MRRCMVPSFLSQILYSCILLIPTAFHIEVRALWCINLLLHASEAFRVLHYADDLPLPLSILRLPTRGTLSRLSLNWSKATLRIHLWSCPRTRQGCWNSWFHYKLIMRFVDHYCFLWILKVIGICPLILQIVMLDVGIVMCSSQLRSHISNNSTLGFPILCLVWSFSSHLMSLLTIWNNNLSNATRRFVREQIF